MKTLLKNGKIFDGSGSSPYFADILIEDDLISRVSTYIDDAADRVIDCTGKSLAPGFIDCHSHNDWFAARKNNERFFTPFLEQGITTQVTGNCGFSTYGYDSDTQYKSLLGSGLFTLGDVEGDTSSLPAFSEAIKNLPLNIVPLYGHMSGRIGISGYDSRALTEEELKHLDEIIEQALLDGAAGISFGLMYEPDRYAPYEELKRAAAICAKHGKILTIHGRANSAVSTSYSPPVGGRAHNLRAIDEMARLARETGVKLQHSHLIFVGEKSWKTVDEALKIIDRLNHEGQSLSYDSYSLTYGASVITVVLPVWFLTLPPEKRASRLTKLRLGFEIGLTKKVLGFNFNDIVISWLCEGEEEYIGKTVAQIAGEWKVSELDAYIKLVEMSNGRGRVLMHRYLTEDIILRLMKDEHCLFMTDAWIEDEGKQNPSCFMCFPLFFKLARENGIELKDMIHRMTEVAAKRFNIEKRGLLQNGCFADIVVFDEKTVAPGADSEGRPTGIDLVIVNGEIAVEDGAFSGNSNAGRLILQKETK
jgi:N-acyl-D-amino-acid deacylase